MAKSQKKSSSSRTPKLDISTERLILIMALIALVALSAVIGFILGIVASPLDFNSNSGAPLTASQR